MAYRTIEDDIRRMIDSETLFVIDGHSIDVEKNELDVNNNVRHIYDTNLNQSISSINKETLSKNNEKDLSSENCTPIDVKRQERDIFVINEYVYEIKTTDGLSVNIYGSSDCIFKLKTDKSFKLSEEDFGANLSTPKDNSIHYYSNGLVTVLSNNITNKIIKYSSSEIIGEHIYTKYYQYFEDSNIAIYLLLIDFTPYRLTTYNNYRGNLHNSFNFIY